MLPGHYGVAFAAKRLAPRTSLGTLAFAAEWLDELWPILLLAGAERVRVVPGLMPASSLDFTWYPYSHSLAFALLWSIVIGGVHFAIRRDRRAALVVGGLVLSHWVLDVPVHRADLPLWPGSPVLVGLGAWRSVPLTILLDGGVFVAGLAIYVTGTRARDAVGRWALWGMVAALAAIFASGLTSAGPTDTRVIAVSALVLWIFIPWSWWIDRHREVRPAA